MRDAFGGSLAGAEVVLDGKGTITNLQGEFRFDNLRTGSHLILIRMVGYSPLRSLVEVRSETSHYDFVLHRAPYQLPTEYAETPRVGVYGTVGDSGFRPLAGVRVQLAGKSGGEVVTDSLGHFGFGAILDGQYLIRATFPGYGEERLFVELKKREGVEVAIRLRPSREFSPQATDLAVRDLGRRLTANLAEDRLSPGQLQRYGSLSLCEVNRVATKVRVPRDSLTIIVNGTFIMRGRSIGDLCSWRADEVQLIEFGESICRDVTRSLVDLLNIWCSNFTGHERGPRGKPITTQPRGVPFVVIWEKL